MCGFLLVAAGVLFVCLIVLVHFRLFPAKAQLVCDLWEMIESENDGQGPARPSSISPSESLTPAVRSSRAPACGAGSHVPGVAAPRLTDPRHGGR